MKEHIPSLMMAGFILFLVLSLWKVYKFLPNKQLEDDDNTIESIEQLTCIMLAVIKNYDTPPTHNELFIAITEHNDFDKEHFWRFNQNKLNNLLLKYYAKNNLTSIDDIHNKLSQ
ncbi:hypothetical protein [Sulfurimonas sp. HSL3-2]|uniref:hypothetical protein n=1 Tax=Hydrocurvibacter mobilis TaxID=3131936 RepID=UPI0031F8C7DD